MKSREGLKSRESSVEIGSLSFQPAIVVGSVSRSGTVQLRIPRARSEPVDIFFQLIIGEALGQPESDLKVEAPLNSRAKP